MSEAAAAGANPPSLKSVDPVPGAKAPSTRAGWVAVAVFLVLYALAYLDRQVLTLLVDPIRKDIGATDFQISVLQGAAFVLFYTLAAIPIGWAVDRFSRRKIIFAGIIVWSLAAAAGGLARNYWQLLLCRFGVGAGEACLSPAAYSIMSDLFPKERLAGAMAVFSSGAIVGGAISLLLGGFIVAAAGVGGQYVLPLIGAVRPWQLVFILSGAPGLVLAFLVFLVREPARSGRMSPVTQSGNTSFAAFLVFLKAKWPFYLAHILGFSLLTVACAGYVAWAPTYLMRSYHLPVSQVGLLLGGLTLVSGLTGMLGSGLIVDHLFRRQVRDAHLRYYVWASLICGLAGLGLAFVGNLFFTLACMAVIGLISPFIAVAAAGLQITTPNDFRGRTSVLFLFFFNVVGYGLGPSIMAGISDFAIGGAGNLGLAMAITFGISTPLAALTFALGLKPMRKAVDEAAAWDSARSLEIQ